MAGQTPSSQKDLVTEDDCHAIWLAENSVLQSNLQRMNQILSARQGRQLSTLQEASETTSQFEHVAYTHVDDLPFLPISTLGSGLMSEVDSVVGEAGDDGIPTRELARKTIHLRGSRRRQLLSALHDEAAVMKSLVHQHIVQVTGTYETLTKPRQFGILMYPVGDEDLSQFLDSVSERGFPQADIQTLEKWLLCLASALDYVHSQGIRHKDIKPQNIICKGNDIFLTDFGQAHKLLKTSSTIGAHADPPNHLYSAPEVLSHGRRGRSADIFALGCVYAEMASVITHRALRDFHAHRTAASAKSAGGPQETARGFAHTQGQIQSWFERCEWPEIYDLLRLMMGHERRPRAYEIVATFVAATTQPTCECVHGPILLPSYWDLAMEFELLPGLVEYPSPGGTFGLPMPKASEVLHGAAAKDGAEMDPAVTENREHSAPQAPSPRTNTGKEEEGSQAASPHLPASIEERPRTHLPRRDGEADAGSPPPSGEPPVLPPPCSPQAADAMASMSRLTLQRPDDAARVPDTTEPPSPAPRSENQPHSPRPSELPRPDEHRHVPSAIPPAGRGPAQAERHPSPARPPPHESPRPGEFPDFI